MQELKIVLSSSMPRGYKACAECNNKKVPIAKKQCECGSVTFLKRNRRKSRNDPRVEGHGLEIIGHIKGFVTIVLEAIDNDDGRLVRKLR